MTKYVVQILRSSALYFAVLGYSAYASEMEAKPNADSLAQDAASEQSLAESQSAESNIDPKGDTASLAIIQETETNPQTVFKRAYVDFKEEHWEIAAAGFLRFVRMTSEDERNYEWAEFFLGICLDKLGFTHGAVDRFSNLAARKPNTKIVAYVLDMFEKISRTQPFDSDQVILQVVNDKDYGFISGHLEGFVHYYQGIQDWKTGHRDWAQDHFKKIPEQNYYYSRYLFHQAIHLIEQDKPKQALKKLSEILKQPDLDETLADESKWVAARLHYELGELKEAGFLYKTIKKPVIQQASFLLEQAWIAYQQENYERAMGYLYAFEAPSFRQFFTPEYYILKSFIYKDVCHYESALSVVSEFQQRYGRSLEAIYNRKKETDQEGEELLYVILAKKDVKQIWAFIQSLEAEREYIDDLDDESLIQYVSDVYKLQIAESSYQIRHLIEDEYKKRANELLKYEEESNLMRYEIGVDMYQRVSEASYKSLPNPYDHKIKTEENTFVTYQFQHEYWNDELGHYQVKLPDQCKSFEDWDLFFQ